MHVLIVSPCFGTFGGLEAFVFRLAEQIVSQGAEATICFKWVRGVSTVDHTLQKYIDESPAAVAFADRASSKLDQWITSADVVHVQNPSIDAVAMAKVRGKPVVMTVHGWSRNMLTPRAILSRLAIHLCERRWYNSDFVWDKWEPFLKRASSGKLPIVSDLPEGRVAPSQRRGFIFASRWIENKGIEVLVEAYAQADLDRGAWPLTLLGDGPLRSRVESLVAELGLENVIMPGFVDNSTRNRLIRTAKWMVTPPHTNEDLGLTPIEARHVGVPCIITRDGGLPEAGGRHALSCEPSDVRQLSALLERAAAMEEAEYERLSQNTYEELKSYLKPLSLYMENYQQVLRR